MNGVTPGDRLILTDAAGRLHQPVPAAEARIVSLVPSITELLCDLGLGGAIVGRTGFCIHPAAQVQRIPKVGGTKDVNLGKIRQLAPTHLVVNIDENEKPVVDQLAAWIPHVIVTHPLAPDDNLALYRLLGGVFQVPQAAEQWCAAYLDARAALTPVTRRQRVLYCIWQDPWMTVSAPTYIAAMLQLAGWDCWSPAGNPARYPAFDWTPAMLEQIDLILLSTEPYRFTEQHVDALERQTGKPVMLVDGEMISWYGSRAVAGLKYLESLHHQI